MFDRERGFTVRSIFLSLLLFALAGCGRTYVDESRIPAIAGGNEAMGAKYPRIVIDGEKLAYDAKAKEYCYAGTDQRAIWLEFGGDAKTPPTRFLATPDRTLPDGRVEMFKGGKWLPADYEPLRPAKNKRK